MKIDWTLKKGDRVTSQGFQKRNRHGTVVKVDVNDVVTVYWDDSGVITQNKLTDLVMLSAKQ